MPLRWMEQHRAAATQLSRVDNLEIACQAVEAGAGIAVLPAFIADPVATLQRVFGEAVGVDTGWVVYHETTRDAARVRAVVDALLEYFRASERPFTGEPPRDSCTPAAKEGGSSLASAMAGLEGGCRSIPEGE
jgi:DNA-binding transcriptional LysR family regulator